LGERSSIHALLDELNTHTEFYSQHQTTQNDGSGALTYLFVSYHKHNKLLGQNPEVLVINSTYKTNRYDMPLVNIVGTTSLNKSFYAASVFMAGETLKDFLFIFQAIKRMYDENLWPYPKTFVSDGDP
jgi:MULE transposase domain